MLAAVGIPRRGRAERKETSATREARRAAPTDSSGDPPPRGGPLRRRVGQSRARTTRGGRATVTAEPRRHAPLPRRPVLNGPVLVRPTGIKGPGVLAVGMQGPAVNLSGRMLRRPLKARSNNPNLSATSSSMRLPQCPEGARHLRLALAQCRLDPTRKVKVASIHTCT